MFFDIINLKKLHLVSYLHSFDGPGHGMLVGFAMKGIPSEKHVKYVQIFLE